MLDSRAGHDDVPQAHRLRARHQPGAGGDRLVQVVGDRGRAQVRPGEGRGQLDQPQGGRGGVRPPGHPGAPLRRGGDRDGVRRAGAGRHRRAEGGDLPAVPTASSPSGWASRPRTSSSTRTSSRSRTGIEEHADYALDVHRGDPPDQGGAAGRAGERRGEQRLLRVPRQRSGARGDPRGLPLPCHRGRDGHGDRERRRSCRSTPTSRPTCSSGSRTWCSTAAPTRPTACSRSPTR